MLMIVQLTAEYSFLSYINVNAAGANSVGVRWTEGPRRRRRPLWHRYTDTNLHH